jgi:prepilin-type N-terminal cleavage/methylation domain-containing protein
MFSNTRKGFTLIELLIVVVIIGILAAIAIPKFATTKEKAYMATMKTDLRNLVTAQEGYFSDTQAFTNDLNALNYASSKNVTVTVSNVATDGWTANSTHALVSGKQCDVYVGSDAAAAGEKDGVPVCS